MNTVQTLIGTTAITLGLASIGVAGGESTHQDKPDVVLSRNSTASKVADRTPTRAIPVSLTTDQQDLALDFAREHHPELAVLLEKLRKSSPEQFSRGIREVHIAEQRLNRFRDRQPARFEMELRSWRLDSKIRLLTARWAISQNSKLEKDIQKLLRQRQEARLEEMKSERDRLASRLSELEDKIGMGTADLEADLAKEWEQLKKKTTSSVRNRKRKGSKKPSSKSPSSMNDRAKGQSESDEKPPPKAKTASEAQDSI